MQGVRLFCNLVAPVIEDLLCEAESVRHFAGARLERHGLAHLPFRRSGIAWQGALREAAIIDTSIVPVPSSVRNGSKARDPRCTDEEGDPAAFRDEAAQRHQSPAAGDECVAACLASGLLELGNCPAALAVTRDHVSGICWINSAGAEPEAISPHKHAFGASGPQEIDRYS